MRVSVNPSQSTWTEDDSSDDFKDDAWLTEILPDHGQYSAHGQNQGDLDEEQSELRFKNGDVREDTCGSDHFSSVFFLEELEEQKNEHCYSCLFQLFYVWH